MTLKSPELIRNLGRVPYGSNGKTYPLNLYRCGCGNTFEANGYNVKRGLTGSCGCISKNQPNRKTHGLSNGPEHRVWSHMKARCNNPKVKEYVYYGARGISVCDRWSSSFETFFADMGARPSPKHSIERRDVNLGYTPDNCYWATTQVQANNTRTNQRICYLGKTQTVAQWATELNIPYPRLYYRLVTANWPIEKAMEN